MSPSGERLPSEPIDQFTKPFTRFLRIEAGAGAALLFCATCAVILANSPWSAAAHAFWELPAGLSLGQFEFSRSIKHWINDGLMTLFFFVVALELKREIVLGELSNPRMAALSLAGAIGGMAAPAAIYVLLTSGGPGAHGWGVAMATDTAFVVGCLAILGTRVPLSLRLFLLSLAIIDDVGAILVVAVGYGGALNVWALAIAGLGLVSVALLARLGVRPVGLYFLAGVVIWAAFDASGIHATLAGVVLGLMTPARGWVSDRRLRAILSRVMARPIGDNWSGDTDERQDLQRAGIATREALSPVERLEIMLHPWVAFVIMPLFALANAGVSLTPAQFDGTIAAAVFAGFVLGKPLGVVGLSYLAVRVGIASKPIELTWPLLAAGSLLTAIGFTMALFIAELAFASDLLVSAKLGIMSASIAAGTFGLLTLFWLTRAARR